MKIFKRLAAASSIVIVILLMMWSCGPSYIEQGEITYEITYPYNTELSATMKMILPKEAKLIFKGSEMITIVKTGKIFRTDIYANEETKELEMRLDFGSDKLFTVLNSEDQKKFRANLPDYIMTPTNEADSVNGLFGKKYITKYKNTDTVPEFESWFTEDLSLRNITWFSNYSGTVGVPLIYDIDQYGIRMHLKITDFTQREVMDEEFNRSHELDSVSFNEYDKKLNELFTILTE